MNSNKDFKGYYKLLGLTSSASDKEIRTAYLTLAKKYHPDKNADTDTSEKFRNIQDAYETLKDPQKRSAYDIGQSGSQEWQGGNENYGFASGANFNMNDIFSEIFGKSFSGGGGGRQQAQPETLELVLEEPFTLEQAYTGTEASITFPRKAKCGKCDGKGVASSNGCRDCGGSGSRTFSNGLFVMSKTCPTCQGTGQQLCSGCKGSGAIREQSSITVKIPAGSEDRARILVKGQGNFGGGRYGDLFVRIRVKVHHLFECIGQDLKIEVHIPFIMSLTGGEITVPCIDGNTVVVNIPRGLYHGQEICVLGKGLKARSTNLYVKVLLEYPDNISDEQIRILEGQIGSLHYKKVTSDKAKFTDYLARRH